MNEKIGHYRWTICSLVFFATTINYLDRQVISLLKPYPEEAFKWTEKDHSYIVMAFQFAYAIGLIGFGRFIDKLGLSEAGNFPAAIKTVAEWFPKKERALATGIFNSGSNVGAIIAPLVVPWIAINWGWQEAFIITGAIGFVWLILWFIYYEVPVKQKRLSTSEFV